MPPVWNMLPLTALFHTHTEHSMCDLIKHKFISAKILQSDRTWTLPLQEYAVFVVTLLYLRDANTEHTDHTPLVNPESFYLHNFSTSVKMLIPITQLEPHLFHTYCNGNDYPAQQAMTHTHTHQNLKRVSVETSGKPFSNRKRKLWSSDTP